MPGERRERHGGWKLGERLGDARVAANVRRLVAFGGEDGGCADGGGGVRERAGVRSAHVPNAAPAVRAPDVAV